MFALVQKDSTKKALLSTAAVLVSIIFLFPIYWLLVSSFKTDQEIFRYPPMIFPHRFYFEGYVGQLTGKHSLLRSVGNSFLISTSAMTISLLLAVPAAYGVSRFRIPGSRVLIMVFLVTQMLPPSVIITPLFLNFARLGLLNTYAGPILSIATITIPFTLIVLRPMFMAYPKALEEAALIDGCNRFSAFLRIVLPITKPGIVTICCFGFVQGWNDLIFSLTYNSDNALFPMTTTIYYLMGQYGIRWNWIMAYGAMLATPPIVVFIAAQKHVIRGLVSGALKG